MTTYQDVIIFLESVPSEIWVVLFMLTFFVTLALVNKFATGKRPEGD